MGARKVGHIDGDVVAVILGQRLVGFPEAQHLRAAHADLGHCALLVFDHRRRGVHDRAVEVGDAPGGSGFDQRLYVGHAQADIAELWTRGVAADLVAPRTGHLDVVFAGLPAEGRAGQFVFESGQPPLQRIEVGHDQTDTAGEHLRVTGRQVELLLANIDPHILRPDHHIRVAGQAES